MDDAFNILGQEFDVPPLFEEAVQERVERVQALAERFGQLQDRIPDEAYSDDEWRIVESASEAVVEAVERAEDGYVAVAYDSHAWYRIMESLEQIEMRLRSAIGIMEAVQERMAGA